MPSPGAESRHNLIYWRYGDYAGVGPGAHGRLDARRQAHRDRRPMRLPERWRETVANATATASPNRRQSAMTMPRASIC